MTLTTHIPIVIVTGSTRELDHLPVASVLRKPVGPDELVETVRKCLDLGVGASRDPAVP